MKKLFALVPLLCIPFLTGCTTYNGMAKADKPESYYIVTNTQAFFFFPDVMLCNSKTDGDLECRDVDVDD